MDRAEIGFKNQKDIVCKMHFKEEVNNMEIGYCKSCKVFVDEDGIKKCEKKRKHDVEISKFRMKKLFKKNTLVLNQ